MYNLQGAIDSIVMSAITGQNFDQLFRCLTVDDADFQALTIDHIEFQLLTVNYAHSIQKNA